jgi:uncharacterized phiE125 gp8 family phage protein
MHIPHIPHTVDIFRTTLPAPAQRYYRSVAPAAAPIALADAKSYLRVDHDDDDNDIQRFINAAISHLDGSGLERDGLLGKALISQSWILEAERPHHGRIIIEYGRVQTITSVEVMTSGAYVAWDSQNFRLGFRDGDAFVTPVSGQTFPPHDHREDAFRVTYVAGYGDAAANIPSNLIEAMLLHIGHLYENRGAVIVEARGQAYAVPMGYMDIVDLHRVNPSV